MTYDLGLVLDGVILVFLGVTIFYAARLSLFLKAFRAGRTGMEILIRDLSVTIDKAESSINVMKAHAAETEQELRQAVGEARSLSEELTFMNETGDGLANRLEKLADRNRELVDLMERSGGIGTQRIEPFDPVQEAEVKSRERSEKKKKMPTPVEETFEIADFDIDVDEDDERDFLALEDGAYREQETLQKPRVNTEAKSKVRSFAIFDRDHVDEKESSVQKDAVDDRFHSRAEQDLYEALQRKKRVSELS